MDKSSTDAINGSQLAATNVALESLGKQLDTLVPYDDGALHYDPVTNGSKGASVTLGKGGRGPVSVSNLAPGVGATDAVNVAQLRDAQRASVQYDKAPDGNGRLILKVSANANTRGDAGGGAGIGFQW